ncbi:uncharacterized protein L969DRAFT_18573 [Mixia osmundae IAM 14324]|uniref:Pre-rRNA-processing protein PNO1 n=1 Tax=Mixia osmundae (strain CBS 9802 / IAM 14324 / JCM 22182 / KY 12970) TaxID=764103 RepID=G7E7Z9_MIXOS|nr:uncharacterized protein L969DRAFT_18573 [Mixia osmundae IAM 14324]KEI38558.1 hypothetical protein L969DRAFT_18573 [Mixia osmundae IAM 14324]GAA98959.1 hypothetical protein E5Q_05647 [Mixia osmundae IAM 14324]
MPSTSGSPATVRTSGRIGSNSFAQAVTAGAAHESDDEDQIVIDLAPANTLGSALVNPVIKSTPSERGKVTFETAPSIKGKERAGDDSATTAELVQDTEMSLSFPALSASETATKHATQTRKVAIPPHRMTPLKKDWMKIYSPLVEEAGLLVRMNVKRRAVELKSSKHTPNPPNTIMQKAVDFLAAYCLGFAAEDAIALVRLDDLYVETFEVKDVKTLHGDHLSRAIGRIAGKDGRTRFTIENVSRTRIVLADSKIHILGSFSGIKIARDAVCQLILGSPPGKVYHGLQNVASRNRQRM